MFIHTPKFFIATFVVLIAGLTAAYGQIDSNIRLTAEIPFSFVLNDRTYPAGEYQIFTSDEAKSSSYLLELKGVDNKNAALFFAEGISSVDPEANSRLLFDQIGNDYFLRKIFVSGDDDGVVLPESKMEHGLIGNKWRYGLVTEKVVSLKTA